MMKSSNPFTKVWPFVTLQVLLQVHQHILHVSSEYTPVTLWSLDRQGWSWGKLILTVTPHRHASLAPSIVAIALPSFVNELVSSIGTFSRIIECSLICMTLALPSLWWGLSFLKLQLVTGQRCPNRVAGKEGSTGSLFQNFQLWFLIIRSLTKRNSTAGRKTTTLSNSIS